MSGETSQIYREAWLGLGRSRARQEIWIPRGPLEPLTWRLLESSLLAPVDFRGARFLSELCAPHHEDEGLGFFLQMLYITLRKGSTLLPGGHLYPEDLKMAALEIYEEAVDILDLRDGHGNESALREVSKADREKDVSNLCTDFLEGLKQGHYQKIIGPDLSTPIVVSEDAPRTGFYFQKSVRAELSFVESLRLKLEESGPWKKTSHPVPEQENLSAEQRHAVDLSLHKKICFITGGPGTGKTTVITSIVERHQKAFGLRPHQIQLSAPTGRAAARMAEAAGAPYQGKTVHRLLGFRPADSTFKYDAQNPLPARLIIVDEVSMLDITLFAALLEAVHSSTHLVLIGDHNQLPSVDSGAVLRDLTSPLAERPLLKDHVAVLTRSFRSEPAIAQTAQWINAGEVDSTVKSLAAPFSVNPAAGGDAPADGLYGGIPGVRFITSEGKDDIEKLRHILTDWMAFHYGSKGESSYRHILSRLEKSPRPPRNPDEPGHGDLNILMSANHRARCLTMMRQGPFGSEAVNRELREVLAATRTAAPDRELSGLPIVVVSNSYRLSLFNGDNGVLIKFETGYWGFFPRGESFLTLPLGELPPWEPALAMTVHKAQGSEFEQALLILPPQKSRILSREILYTGITRARRFAGLVGPPDVFAFCVKRSMGRTSTLYSGLTKEYTPNLLKKIQ